MKPHYKQTEVGIIPEDWDVFKFGDIVTIRNLKVVAASTSTGTQCVELESMGQGTGRLLMSYETRGMSAKYSFRKGDVLFGRLRAYLRKFWHATFDGICSTEIWPLIPRNERLSGNFLHLLVQTNDFVNTAGVSYGTHMPRSDWSVLKEFPVRLPRIAEQCSIAEVLFHVDALIGALDRLIAKKRDLKQATMQQLLTGQTRLPGFSGAWELKPLKQFVTMDRFAIVDGPFGSQLKVHEYIESGVPVIEMEHLYDDFITERIERCITPRKFEDLKRSAVYPGDIIISKTGSLGKLGRIPDCVVRGLITSRLAKITIDPSHADRSFVFQCLLALRGEGYWEKVSQGGTMQILGIAMLQNAPIPNITVPEQSAIATVLSDMDAEMA